MVERKAREPRFGYADLVAALGKEQADKVALKVRQTHVGKMQSTEILAACCAIVEGKRLGAAHELASVGRMAVAYWSQHDNERLQVLNYLRNVIHERQNNRIKEVQG